MTPAAHEPARRALRALLLATAFLALLAVASPAGAAKSCGRAVIDDWYDDGRVDGTYPLHCYDDAIKILPPDVRDYSSAKEDIQRALTFRKRGEPAPPARTDPTPDDEKPPKAPDDRKKTDTTETTGTPPGDDPGDPPTDTVAAPTDTESASSIPIPLLILAGLALLLVAGGSAGYIVRRLQARNGPPPAL